MSGKLPAGWEEKKLGEVCIIRTGKKDVNEGNPQGEYPFFTCARNHTYSDTFSFDTEALLVAGNGDVGHVQYYTGKFEAYQRTYILSDFQEIMPRLLYCFLDSYLKDTVSKQKLGNTMPYIKMGMLTNFYIPLPPLPEQKRIVAILDEAFSAIAKAKENAEKNLADARELFESYLEGVFKRGARGDAEGAEWEEKKLGEIAHFRNGMNFTKVSKGELIKLVGVKDFKNNFLVPFDDLESVTIDGELAEIDCLRKNDILAVRSNGNPELIGRTIHANESNAKVSHSGFTIRIRSITNEIDTIYLCQFLKLPSTRRKLVESGTGVNIKSLNQVALSSLPIKYPQKISEQRRIVERLDALSAETKRLEEIFRRKIADLDELKKAILERAFKGEL